MVKVGCNNEDFSLESEILYNSGYQYNDSVRLLYCLDGTSTVRIDNKDYFLQKGMPLIVNEGRYYSVNSHDGALLVSVCFNPQIFNESIGTDLYFLWIDPNGTNDNNVVVLKSLLNELIFYDLQVEGKNDFFKFSIFYKLMDFLVKNYLYKMDKGKSYSNGDVRTQQIRTYIRKNYMRRLTLTQLSEELFISEGYLSRFFKKQLGNGFLRYLNSVRLYHTVNDLINTDMGITDISMKNGFNSISGFNQLFKKEYGLSPKEYRNKYRNKNESDKNKKLIKNKTFLFLKQHSDDIPKITKSTHEVKIDSRKYTNFRKNWQSIINMGNAMSLLQERVQKSAKRLHEDLGFKYLRIWNIFESVDVDENTDNVNFDKLDTVIDFILENDMKPFIVLGPKPRILTVNLSNKPLNYQTNEEMLSKEGDSWFSVLSKWVDHIRFRYGNRAISSWLFEIWKPNKWDKIYENDYLDEWYINWMKTTIKVLKSSINAAKIGGCEFVMYEGQTTDEIKRIVSVWKEIQFEPDFISISDYPYEIDGISTRMNQLQYFIENARDTFERFYPDIDIYVTEWNLTVSNRNVLNDTTFKGAYMIQNITNELESAEETAYWMGSDIYSEYSDSSEILYGASGIITKNDIKKPSFYAFEFLNKLLNKKLYSDNNSFVSTDGMDSFTILLNCSKPFNNYYYLNKGNVSRDDYDKIFLDVEPTEIKIQLDNVNNGIYEIRKQTVDQNHGNILGLWKMLNYSSHLTLDDENYLKNMSIPELQVTRKDVNDNVINVEETIEANTFMLISLSYLK
ncbi:helix-turn-helix domain-containing protein [Companilactobacillus huachuanensis]|uniref:Helix-turn-helix domain-containing protein n=1 Tax=Companilactobacillus huachuanensis TaxID=2559914 RepID=A0ABW1RQK6_9LACO|nr:helix-turn-helix domain-containing protein [Companilactobacillus huachuanensis]